MQNIHLDLQLKRLAPDLRIGYIFSCIEVSNSSSGLLEKINTSILTLRNRLIVKEVSQIPEIQSTKAAYRALGKDPSRYRPSAEALLRRIIKGNNLYKICNAIDLLNLVSMESGFSIGGYDADKITGQISFGIGSADELYRGIGRGVLNIENLPVFRDEDGPFGSPTSDSERTMVTSATENFLMLIFDFGRHASLPAAIEQSSLLLTEFCGAKDLITDII